MKGKTMMEELTRFKKIGNRFLNSLLSSIEHFRKGEDHSGLDCFLNSMDDLERMLELYQYFGKPQGNFGKIVPTVQKVHVCMQNQDVAGMTDVLEFTLYPLVKGWIEECAEK